MRTVLGPALLVAALAVAGCSGDSSSSGPTAGSPATSASASPDDPAEPALDAAVSEPVEDSVYPDVGDPGVDALHYDLDLAWSPDTSTLDGHETLVFRSTRDADRFQLDFSQALEVTSVRLDGEDVSHSQDGKDLVVRTPVEEDERYVLEVVYSGTPEPAEAPTTRGDISTLGWTITPNGQTWTMQEPFGAYTWYAVNDQPSDKALYDFTISVPSPWVGVANGELTSRTEDAGTTTTRWHLDEPAASYLTTVAIGDYRMTTDTSASGVPITYWTFRDQPASARGLRSTAAGLDWLEKRLGPYPFSSLGIVLVDSRSGMETQTMITLGTTDYATSPAVLVHEMAHQWYGDEVTPDDWRDVWMNEGMAMYLQSVWEADTTGQGLPQVLDALMEREPTDRAESGPPAAYDPDAFGESNIYYGPALMWDALRQKVGNKTFWRLVRDWPAVHRNGSAGRDDYLPWIEKETGRDLDTFFDAWLLGRTSPLESRG